MEIKDKAQVLKEKLEKQRERKEREKENTTTEQTENNFNPLSIDNGKTTTEKTALENFSQLISLVAKDEIPIGVLKGELRNGFLK